MKSSVKNNEKLQKSAKRTKKQKNNNVKSSKTIIMASAAVLIVVVVIFLFIVAKRNIEQERTQTNQTDYIDTTDYTDYNQATTNENGEEFDRTYQQSSGRNLDVRFKDLECKDSCSNIGDIELNGQRLDSQDYEVKKGSVIVIIHSTLLDDLQPGEYSLTFTIESNGIQRRIGLNFTIIAAPTCSEKETLIDGKCESNNPTYSQQKPSSSDLDDEHIELPDLGTDLACPKDPWWNDDQMQYKYCSNIISQYDVLHMGQNGNPQDALNQDLFVQWGASKEFKTTHFTWIYYYWQNNVPMSSVAKIGLYDFFKGWDANIMLKIDGDYTNDKWTLSWYLENNGTVSLDKGILEKTMLTTEQIKKIDQIVSEGQNFVNKAEAGFQRNKDSTYANRK